MEGLLLLGGLTAVLGAILAAGAVKNAPHVLFAVAGDEDVKIASGSFSPAPTAEDSAQAEAELYLRQKRAGNIDRARALGEDYAKALADWAETLPTAGAASERDRQRFHHQLLLYSYGVNRVIAEQSPNSILAQTCLNVFYDAAESATPDISEHIKDMAAFSLYILVDRSRNRSEEEIGRIYAQLCGADGERSLIEEGDRVYRESCEAAALRMEAAFTDDA